MLSSSLAHSSKQHGRADSHRQVSRRNFQTHASLLSLKVHKRPLYRFCYGHLLIHFIHYLTGPFVAQPHFRSYHHMKCPTLQACVFIKHHDYFATKPEVEPYFPPGTSLQNCLLFHGRMCRAGLLSSFHCCYLRFEPVAFLFLFNSGVYVNIGIHQRTHITLLSSIPSPVTLPSILPFNLINMG